MRYDVPRLAAVGRVEQIARVSCMTCISSVLIIRYVFVVVIATDIDHAGSLGLAISRVHAHNVQVR